MFPSQNAASVCWGWWAMKQTLLLGRLFYLNYLDFIFMGIQRCNWHWSHINNCPAVVALIFRSLTPLIFCLMSDWADNDRAGDCCEPARGGVGGDPGVGDHPAATVWPWLDRHEKSGQQLLPQLCHAGAFHCSRLPEQVSTLFDPPCDTHNRKGMKIKLMPLNQCL